MVLLADFNCDLKFSNDDYGLRTNAGKLCSIFEMFNMQNIATENTRVTSHRAQALIYLIVTTRKDLISTSGVFTLTITRFTQS